MVPVRWGNGNDESDSVSSSRFDHTWQRAGNAFGREKKRFC